VSEVEGRARIEGVAASIHESYVDCHGNKVAEDAVLKTPCVVIIFDEAPRYREVQSKSDNKQTRMTVHRDRGSGPAAMRDDTCSQTTFEQDLPWRAKGNPRTRSDDERDSLV